MDDRNINNTAGINANRTQAVFEMRHIVAEILSKLDPRTLLTCRRVSPLWAFLGARELQKTVTITMHISSSDSSLYIDSLGKGCCEIWESTGNNHDLHCSVNVVALANGNRNQNTTPSRNRQLMTLEALNTLMNNSAEFPCKSLKLQWETWDLTMTEEVCRFLTAHGSHFSHLEIEKSPHGPSMINSLRVIQNSRFRHFLHRIEISPNPSFSIHYQDLKILLGRQMTNLVSLKIEGDVQPTETMAARAHVHQILDTKVRFSLKSLHIAGKISKDVFQRIVQASPNLVQAVLNNKYFDHFVQLNRLDLLKTLVIDPQDLDEDSTTFQLLESILQTQRQSKEHRSCFEQIKLEQLTLCLHKFQIRLHSRYHHSPQDVNGIAALNPMAIWSKVAHIINLILRGSSDSLNKLVCDSLQFLEEFGLQIPRLPGVRHIALKSHSGFYVLQLNRPSNFKLNSNPYQVSRMPTLLQDYFPKGIQMHEAFPNVKVVTREC